ncbi:hypothetical protein RJT34_13701 [Clitoria ternatea]|uniref:VQ domain-containing protein n=1 Tax=Clitoria ternatea TaxID=43366 RepID=A0AAN9JP12_CLITE
MDSISPRLKPQTPTPVNNPYPTTFVQTDPCSFKQVVQRLTGSSEIAKQASSPCSKPVNPTHTIPPVKSMPNKKQQSGFKLYERRNLRKNLNLNLFSSNINNINITSPRNHDILSPSILNFPALALSPVSPLSDPFNRPTNPHSLDTEAEEKAIKEKGFFLHPSPASTPRHSEPRLLSLFPTTSPRASPSSS